MTGISNKREQAAAASFNWFKPYLYINPKTARRLGIENGRKVKVESTAGYAYAYAYYTEGLRGCCSGYIRMVGEYNINKTVPLSTLRIGMVCARGYLRVTLLKIW